MDIQINNQSFSLPKNARLIDALASYSEVPLPYAVAINGEFVPRSQYSVRALMPDDQVDILRPVVGG
ncbi:sulfur carrier protein ThiS [Candidatus Vallotia cooleyia]|uniref:sulfur carrier protein ThiS n=1 Tax=Candidatus Vallotiella adelgis TaxID=1177211 RepID=UPI001D030FE7|nr:sulfur carrier protein ThiS [Candidatus Vallotia cooleyia]UDG82264.1 hypothetical protein GJV44_00521 [Candidatus Vallotia cooleyia]